MSERSVSFPTQSKFDAFPYVSCLRKETFRTSNTKLGVSVGILRETKKICIYFPLILKLRSKNQGRICKVKSSKPLNMNAV